MRLDRLWLTDFRNYTSAELALAPAGLTVVRGGNGEGKTNLLEAVGWLATLSSFRGAPPEAMVRVGCASAVVRAAGSRAGRDLLIEGSIVPGGRSRAQVNRQPLRRARDLLGALRVSVFSPDDLVLVKGGPGERRRFLDELLVAVHPRWDALQAEVERVLRQRNVLLKQAGGRMTAEVLHTLDVWDARLAASGTELAAGRDGLVGQLGPAAGEAYRRLAGGAAAGVPVGLSYHAPWRAEQGGPGLAAALEASRADDVRRGVSTVGPHRDDVTVVLNGMPARTHASQGEQRSVALALRLGGHEVVTASVGEPPVLLLDDVFSELDAGRTEALVALLPEGQALLTTAGPVPAGVAPAATLVVRAGRVGCA